MKKLDIWKDKLLDTGKRNPLINFKHSERSQKHLQVIDEKPTEVFRQIFKNQEKFQFQASDEDNSEDLGVSEFKKYNKDDLDTRYTDNKLQTNLNQDYLDSKLRQIHRFQVSVIEEQGYNTLFLSLGILEWYESPSHSQKPNNSPLILLPVKLVPRKGFSLNLNCRRKVLSKPS